MVNWKLISKFSLVFGVVFIVFAVIAGVINYQMDKLQYSSQVPMSFIDYSVIAAMLPFLVAAVISFVVVVLSPQDAKSAEEKEPETQTTLETSTEETPT